MRYLNIVILLCLNQLNVFTQVAGVSGTVTNNGQKVDYADVVIEGTSIGVSTDEDGNYNIKNLSPGTYTLVTSMLGYKSMKKVITILKNEHLIINFELEEVSHIMDAVVISGGMKEVSKLDSPVPIEVYSKVFFKANPTPSIFESLQNVNGVRPQLNCNVCNTGDIHINGLEGPYTMVLIDGMPIVSGLSTVYGLTGIPQALIERVEIVKGPASTLYGSEAVGGLINIITKKPQNAPLFSADIFSSDWGDVNTDLGFKFNAGKKIQAVVGVNYFNFQNRVDKNKDRFTDITLQNRFSIFNKWNIERKEYRIFSLAARYVFEDRWGGDVLWNKSFRGGDSIYAESIYTQRWETFGTYQLPTNQKILLQFSANGHAQNSVYGDVPFKADQYIGFAQLTWFTNFKKHDLLLGAAYRYTWYDDNTPVTFDSKSGAGLNLPSKIHLPGIFVQDEISIAEHSKLLMGIRYDYNNVHGSVWTPRLNYKLSSKDKTNILRLSAGNGYRVANVFTEDHAALTGARKVEFIGELKPETSWNGNVNFVKKIYLKSGANINFDASGWYTYFNNRIIPDYLTDPNKIIYDNLDGHAVSKGISLNIDIDLDNGLKFICGLTYMDVSFTEESVTQRQLLTEKISGTWSISYGLASGWSFDYTGNIYGPMILPTLGPLDDRPSHSPTWSLQNIQITKSFNNGAEIYGGIKNILNFTPPANSIARAFDPFDKDVLFDSNGQVIPTPNNPNGLTFDPNYVFAPNQGIRIFLGFRYNLEK